MERASEREMGGTTLLSGEVRVSEESTSVLGWRNETETESDAESMEREGEEEVV